MDTRDDEALFAERGGDGFTDAAEERPGGPGSLARRIELKDVEGVVDVVIEVE